MAFMEYRSNGPLIHLLIPQLLQKIHIHLAPSCNTTILPSYRKRIPNHRDSHRLIPPSLRFSLPSVLAVGRKDGGGGKAKLVAGRTPRDLPPSSLFFSFLFFAFLSTTLPPYLILPYLHS